MRMSGSLLKRMTMAVTAATLLIGVATVGVVRADDDDAGETCPGNQTLASLDSKTCPANNKRPAVVVRRACCAKADRKGDPKVHCKHFPHCPNNSPS